jgi:hypothetical protein
LTDRAYIAAAKRKDRSREGKIESAKKGSEAHYETHGKYFYLTEEIILSTRAFEELEEEEQIFDPELILPDGVTRQNVLEDLRTAGHLQVAFEPQEGMMTSVPFASASAAASLGTTPDSIQIGAPFPYPQGFGLVKMEATDISPVGISSTDLSLHSTKIALESSVEEFDFDEYLRDPDEPLKEENGEQVKEQPILSTGQNLDLDGWADYILDIEDFPEDQDGDARVVLTVEEVE